MRGSVSSWHEDYPSAGRTWSGSVAVHTNAVESLIELHVTCERNALCVVDEHHTTMVLQRFWELVSFLTCSLLFPAMRPSTLLYLGLDPCAVQSPNA